MTYTILKLIKWYLNKTFGYCPPEERKYLNHVFNKEGTCTGCNASDVQDWLTDIIE